MRFSVISPELLAFLKICFIGRFVNDPNKNILNRYPSEIDKVEHTCLNHDNSDFNKPNFLKEQEGVFNLIIVDWSTTKFINDIPAFFREVFYALGQSGTFIVPLSINMNYIDDTLTKENPWRRSGQSIISNPKYISDEEKESKYRTIRGHCIVELAQEWTSLLKRIGFRNIQFDYDYYPFSDSRLVVPEDSLFLTPYLVCVK